MGKSKGTGSIIDHDVTCTCETQAVCLFRELSLTAPRHPNGNKMRKVGKNRKKATAAFPGGPHFLPLLLTTQLISMTNVTQQHERNCVLRLCRAPHCVPQVAVHLLLGPAALLNGLPGVSQAPQLRATLVNQAPGFEE